MDRRVVRTRQQLRGALTELLKTKSVQDITVCELADKVNISRGTFYLHYKNVFDMLEKIEQEMLEELAATNCESYYRGALMEKIVAFSRETGGFFREEDFTSYHPQWVEPITADYKGYTVCEIPPNGHGLTVLMALNILKGLELSEEKDCADTYHKIL